MQTNELIDLTNEICERKAETQTIEVKSAHHGCPKRLYDTLSSFSNQDSGGILVFGIDEEQGFLPVGVYDLQDLQRRVMEQCRQMAPPVCAVFTTAVLKNGVEICSAEIPGIELSERPCYYKGSGRLKGAYIRVGDADCVMTDYELYQFEAYRKHLHDDERPIERSTLAALDQDRLKKYVVQMQLAKPGFSKLPEDQTLEMLNITRDGVPTLAAVMNFGIYPQGYLPQLAITAIVVPGAAIGDTAPGDIRFVDNKRIEGTLAEMVEEALAFCKRNMKVQTIVDTATGKRRDQTEYPMAALREAILNAVIHRDYSVHTEGTPIQLNLFTDRIEIHSPGNLYGRVTVDMLGVAKPDLRNPVLAVMTEYQTAAENRYSGIPTMRREMARYGLPEPVFENRRNEFVVIFYNRREKIISSNNNRDEVSEKLLQFCEEPKSRREIADYLGIKTLYYVSSKYIQPLINQGLLQMTLPDKPKSRNQRYYAHRQERG